MSLRQGWTTVCVEVVLAEDRVVVLAGRPRTFTNAPVDLVVGNLGAVTALASAGALVLGVLLAG